MTGRQHGGCWPQPSASPWRCWPHQMYVVFAPDHRRHPAVQSRIRAISGAAAQLRAARRGQRRAGGGHLCRHPTSPSRRRTRSGGRGFAKDTLHYGGAPSLLTPVKGAIGAVSTMLTMNGLMAFDAPAERLMTAFPGKSLLEERYLAQTAIPSWPAPADPAGDAGGCGLALPGLGRGHRPLACRAARRLRRPGAAGGGDRLRGAGDDLGAHQPGVLDPDLCLRDALVPAPDHPLRGRAPDRRPGPGGLPLSGELRRRPLPALGSALGLLAPLQRGSHRAARRGRSDRDLLLLALLLVPAVFRRGGSALSGLYRA